jgi:DNA polymerase III alpha subunit
VPLRVRSYYTFLDSTLSPAAIVNCAKQHGLLAIALTDIGNLHGAVEFAQAAKRAGIKPIFGTELQVGEHPLLLYVESARGYHNLNRLLSLRAEKDNEEGAVAAQQRRPIRFERLDSFTEGLIAVSPDLRLAELFPGRFYQMATKHLSPVLPHDPHPVSGHSLPFPRARDFPVVACPAIHYAVPGDRMKYDIVQSIRTLTLLRQVHPSKRMEGRLYFRTPAEMVEARKDHADWFAHSLEIADRSNFEMPFGKLQFPAYAQPRCARKWNKSCASSAPSVTKNTFWSCGTSCKIAARTASNGSPAAARRTRSFAIA